ncbi:hypothetical protein CEUSTIGMA_g13522.t1 [Chlamydomonas eustigma]|uniref:KIF-binding protein n=1 Tax=Chlamydomonas eustigma TaxID=1157962 RepID=A0A250XTJ9_9CHLO|nr:hypothetical protein CEUSTIGMA_g13522.t1 [Chlamydomonas eustigma]|eukprot:GAX86110.1 hypothetical protein CEUSTIGMA_g13522.t1 [Chlamydomonas eustigma]
MKLKRSNKEPEGSIALAEAEALQQKGEKKRGQEAIGILQQASARFRDAISMGLPSEDELHDARFGSAWCLALCAEATKAAADALPDHLISRKKDVEAKHVALRLYSQAVAEYKQVLDSYGKVRSDAAVNAGNALCAVAELLVSSNSHGSRSTLTEVCTAEVQAYEEARHLYQSALTRTGYEDSNNQGCSTSRSVDEEGEQDADTWCNLADCLMSYAQLLTDRKASLPQERQGEAAALCQAALQAYEQACAVSDSSHGDDLPGLLCNWGSGLIAAALMTEPPRIELLHQAISQLQHSASFSRADTAPLNRLGDAWVHLAELAEAAMVHEEAKLMFTKALEEGYGRALAINRMDPEALDRELSPLVEALVVLALSVF